MFGFVWPYAAYRIASRHEKPVPTEYRNLRLDALFCGFWAVAMGFNLLPTGIMVVVLLMDNAMVGGVKLLAESAAGLLLGGLLAAIVLLGVPLCYYSDVLVRWACAPFIVIYPVSVGVISFRNGLKVVKEKRLLRELNEHDSLSGVHSRAYWERRLAEEFQRFKLYRRRAAVILLDIDNFKTINDSFGHIAGDDVIRALGPLLRNHMRPGDIPARLGGDEFGILLPEATRDDALAVVRGIQQAVAGRMFGEEGKPFSVTLSFGIAAIPETAETHAHWLHCADQALYQAKRGGRNDCAVFGADTPACWKSSLGQV